MNSISISDIGIIILILFGISRIILGIYGRKWICGNPASGELDEYSKERTSNLTLAGFAFTVIALFLTMGFSGDNKNEIIVYDSVFFFSISLIVFIISSYFYNFSTSRVYPYVAGSLEFIGLLSIGLGLLIFFLDNFNDDPRFSFIYVIFVIMIFFISFKDNKQFGKLFKVDVWFTDLFKKIKIKLKW